MPNNLYNFVQMFFTWWLKMNFKSKCRPTELLCDISFILIAPIGSKLITRLRLQENVLYLVLSALTAIMLTNSNELTNASSLLVLCHIF